MDAEFWDTRYADVARVWSGTPNPHLVSEVQSMAAGAALDAGCGEGADAVWLAEHGWSVTAVDFSRNALDKGAAEAQKRRLEIDWRCEDLISWQPGAYDLVSVQFLHLEPVYWNAALGRLVASVQTSGTLLVVGHHPDDAASGKHSRAHVLFTPGDVTAMLADHEWRVDTAETRLRTAGESQVTDTVVRAVRLRGSFAAG